MAYLAVNGVDYSHLVNSLAVTSEANYNAQTNAAGNTVVDYINTKRAVEVGFIPLSDAECSSLFSNMQDIAVTLSFLDPKSGEMTEAACLCPSDSVEYYTIRADKVSFKAFTLKFTEL